MVLLLLQPLDISGNLQRSEEYRLRFMEVHLMPYIVPLVLPGERVCRTQAGLSLDRNETNTYEMSTALCRL